MTIKLKDSLMANNSIALNQSAENWESAIKIGTDLLEATGVITTDYYKNIIASVKELGPYIILAPGLAMPHARPEHGVKQTAFALVTLREPVHFEGEEEPIQVLVTLAGADAHSHVLALQQIVALFDDEESETGINLERVTKCRTTEEVLAMIDKYAV